MKRIITLALAAAMFGGASLSAQAAEIKVNGYWHMAGVYENHLGLVDGNSPSTLGSGDKSEFSVKHRINVNIDIINSENLKANLAVMAPSMGEWGQNQFTAGGGELQVNLIRAYVDWFVPETDIKVRMGLQPNLKPNYLGRNSNPVFHHYAPGISLDVPINEDILFQAQWLRLLDSDRTYNSLTANRTSINADFFTVALPIKFKNALVTPWASYLTKASDLDAPQAGRMNGMGDNTYWLGLTSSFTMFEPLTFSFDLLYSSAHSKNPQNSTHYNTVNFDGYGWLVDGTVSYRSQYGSTKLAAWYSPGANSDGKNGQIGSIISTWATGSAFFYQDFFGSPALLPSSGADSPNGTLGIMLSHTGFELMKDVHLGGHVMYVKGTHDPKSVAAGSLFEPSHLTDNDSLVEFAFWTRYQIMQNLASALDISYIMEDFDTNVWHTDKDHGFTDGFRASLSFFYTF